MQVENTNCARFRALEQKRKKAEVEIKIKIYFIIKIHIAIKIMRRLAFIHCVFSNVSSNCPIVTLVTFV